MIISKIDGGMGNQMFQYAYGYSLAKKKGVDLAIEHHAYAWRPRSFQLNNFKISANILNFPVAKKNTKISKLWAELKRKKLIIWNYKCKQICENRTGIYSFHDEFMRFSGDKIYLDGFFQSWRYFEWCKKDIIREFSFKDELLSTTTRDLIKKVTSEKSIAMHIRKGDYPENWLIPKKFYSDAYCRIIKEIGTDVKCYIFCENIEYAQEIVNKLPNVEVITGNYNMSDFEEFVVMSACKNQIISNSTFSWWAAYLNQFPNKIVVAPVFSMWQREYYPDSWFCITE